MRANVVEIYPSEKEPICYKYALIEKQYFYSQVWAWNDRYFESFDKLCDIFVIPFEQDSHKLWRSWKTWKKSSMHGKIMEF